jgi:GntR family transcriptional regulator, arabinose operon transcriptional repressor
MAITAEIGRGSEKTLYRKVIDEILQDIRVGKLPLGSKLPSQSELIRKYNVSTGTIRQSLASLERRGIIRKERGRGSFVSLQSRREEKSSELRHLGLIFEHTNIPGDQPAEMEIVQTFVNTCREHQIRFTCIDADYDTHPSGTELIKTFEGITLDGICIFLHGAGDDVYERLLPLAREFRAPVALLPAYEEHTSPMDYVDIEIRTGLYHLMKYLLAMGHRRIAYVGSHMQECLKGDPKRITGGRWQVYTESLQQAGIPVDTSLLVEVPFGSEPDDRIGRQVVDLVRQKDPVTAIFSYNDWLARYILHWLWREGICVPRDVSVTGLDDISFSRLLIPPLTTVSCPYAKAAETIIRLMQRRLAQPDRPIQRVTIPSELILRDTVEPVKRS